MKHVLKFLLLALVVLAAVAATTLFVRQHNNGIFNPQGVIGLKERNLIVFAVLLMLLLVVPVIVTFFIFAWKYRVGNTKAKRAQGASGSSRSELVWWILPSIVVLVLAIVTWKGTHELDPSKPIPSNVKPLSIQVVALNWKWLFIYPEQGIATVNFVQFPERTPLQFELTADAPMNSFWIPQLGGQMYAMAGMTNKLHLMADSIGEFAGSAAEINGRGFAGMKFVAKSTSQADFDAWVASVRQSPSALTRSEYEKLAEPSENNPRTFYSSVEKDLYDTIMMKFMPPGPSTEINGATHMTPGMEM